jgi:hypothetical protein
MRRVDRPRNLRYEEWPAEPRAGPHPAALVEKLFASQEEIGLSGIRAELNCSGLIPHDKVLTAMRLRCEEVMLRLPSSANRAKYSGTR